jgi:hypothetical protein
MIRDSVRWNCRHHCDYQGAIKKLRVLHFSIFAGPYNSSRASWCPRAPVWRSLSYIKEGRKKGRNKERKKGMEGKKKVGRKEVRKKRKKERKKGRNKGWKERRNDGGNEPKRIDES